MILPRKRHAQRRVKTVCGSIGLCTQHRKPGCTVFFGPESGYIEGGVPPRAWAMLTGCKDQYTITEEASGKDTGKWTCWGNYNKQRDFYNELENSSKGKQPPMWQQDWPAVGGGGEGGARGVGS